jgi:hypothetical protein
MELERLEDIKRIEEREKKRQEDLQKGADIVRQQIEERRVANLLEQERRDQESKALLKSIEKVLEADKQEKAKKHLVQKELLTEVMLKNIHSDRLSRLMFLLLKSRNKTNVMKLQKINASFNTCYKKRLKRLKRKRLNKKERLKEKRNCPD